MKQEDKLQQEVMTKRKEGMSETRKKKRILLRKDAT